MTITRNPTVTQRMAAPACSIVCLEILAPFYFIFLKKISTTYVGMGSFYFFMRIFGMLMLNHDVNICHWMVLIVYLS